MTNFTLRAGAPHEQTIRVSLPVGRSYWTDADDFEVLAQVRKSRAQTAELMVDLAQFFTVTLDGDDIVVAWVMTGADTRLLEGKGGYYDMVVSDADTVDARALVVLEGKLIVKPTVTADAAEDES